MGTLSRPRRHRVALLVGLVGLVVLAIAIGGCDRLAALRPAPTPAVCGLVFGETRCEVVTVATAVGLGVDPEDIALLEIMPDPTPEVGDDGGVILGSGGPSLEVRVQLHDGTIRLHTLHCGGIASGYYPPCMDEPHLRAVSMTRDGYRDIPCVGETPAGCATPQPAIQADAAADAEPITIGTLDVRVDRKGQHEIPIGRGSLPNGILTEAAFELVDPWPDGLIILDGSVFLDVRSLEPNGTPFDNYYLHGWRDGVERIEAVLVFTADNVEPGAVLRIREVVVR